LYGRHRPDVRASLAGPPASEWSGFRIALRLPPGGSRVHLEALAEDGGWAEFHSLDFSIPWTAAARNALRMARFWAEAALGRPASLDRLPPWEQAFVLAKIDQSGGHPLSTSLHYAPRPLTFEHFPSGRLGPDRLPKVTVVTPSFQQGRYLEATLLSVLDQKGVRLDYIVRDGGSTDATPGLLRRHSDRLKHWASEPDGGQADAVRQGFARADCGPEDVMTFLNSDDLFMPGALRFVAEYFARNPAVDVVYGHRLLIDESGLDVGRWFTPRRSCLGLLMHDLVPQETLFWRKRIWDRVGGVDPEFRFALDWDLLLRFAAAGARFQRLPWFLGLFRIHPQQKSQVLMREVGAPEMDRLRLRTLGRAPKKDEMDASMRRAQIDSTVQAAFWRRGWRI
jgi:hypothetical protein